MELFAFTFTLNFTPLIVMLKWYLFILFFVCFIWVKSKRICEIRGFVIFPFFTYPVFLEVLDFTELSDYVVLDFLYNRLYRKIQILRQPENTYNQTAVVFGFLVFHRSFIWVVVLPVFVQILKGHKLHCKRA